MAKTPIAVNRALVCLSLLGLLVLLAPPPLHGSRQAGTIYDLVIRDGRVMDPESGRDAIRDIGISGGIIRAVSPEPLKGQTHIAATGLVVAPGFIDLDSYPVHGRIQVRDGVTRVLDIREGTANVGHWYSEYEGRMPINFGVGVGYLPVRREVMGAAGSLGREGGRKEPSEAEISEILRQLQRGFDEGGVALGMGVSGGLDPSGWEILEAFRLSARANAHVVATLRDDLWHASNISANLSQMIGAAAVAGAAVHIPHLTSSAGPHSPRLLATIERARAQELDVTAEDYPYTAAIGRVRPVEADDWSDEDWQDVQLIETGQRLTRALVRALPEGGALVVFHNSSIEPYVVEVLASPFVSIASHAYLDEQGRGHPRTAGTYSRLLGRYVREEKLLSLMDALRKVTLLPARRLQARVPAMRNKGRIREGADADIVAFDADQIIDRATFDDPTRASEGIRHVLVNGVPVVREGLIQERVFAGKPVRATLKPAAIEDGRIDELICPPALGGYAPPMVTDAPDEQALSESRSWECSLIRTTNGSNPTLSRDALRVIDRLKAAYGTREAVIDEAVRQLKTRNCRDSRTSREREKSAEAHIWTGLVSAYERVLGGTQKNKTIAEAHVPAIVTDQGRRAPARLRSKSHRK